MGVSGFSYPGWKGRFYPAEAKSDEFLALYSKRLRSVEINSSFYARPSTVTVKGWSERTSEIFRFSFKAPRTVTHIMKLGKGSADEAGKFSKSLELLGPRRGPVLFQLPPFLRQNVGLLSEFLSETSEIEDRVFEFRHDSWFQNSTYQLLDRGGASFCIAETEDLKPVFKITGKMAYFRLRMDSYESHVIGNWAGKIREMMKSPEETYVYLRHDETGENALLAERLSEILRKAN